MTQKLVCVKINAKLRKSKGKTFTYFTNLLSCILKARAVFSNSQANLSAQSFPSIACKATLAISVMRSFFLLAPALIAPLGFLMPNLGKTSTDSTNITAIPINPEIAINNGSNAFLSFFSGATSFVDVILTLC